MTPTDPDTLARLEAASAPPSPAELADAPALRKWNPVRWHGEDVVRFEGYVSGHPTITDPRMTTSPVLSIDLDAGWARSMTRWYRLDVASYRAVDPGRRDEELAALEAEIEAVRRTLFPGTTPD